MKLRKISEITATLPFTEFYFMQKYRESFAVSELGRIHAQLPLKELTEKIRSHFPKTHPQGNTPMFPPEGEVALMLLKPYTGQSDDGLIEMLNGMFRLVLSMFLGMIVGAERKRKGQIAGIRTFALISMGACLAMLLSIYVPQAYLGLKNGDPGRIAAQVITGIGFLGGGAMIHMKGAVRGLTTAAGIWMTAIIGMAVGIGMYLCSIGATLLILLTLVTFEQYEKRRKLGQESKVINLTVEGIVGDIEKYREVFRQHNVHLSTFYIEYDYEHNRTHLDFVVLAHAYADLLPMLNSVGEAGATRRLTLSSQIDI